jgi:SAM-dependent methyltransferase
MSEANRRDSEGLPIIETSSPAEIVEVLEGWKKSPRGDDRRTSAYAYAASALIEAGYPPIMEAIETMTSFRYERGRPTPALYASDLMLRTAQHFLGKRANYAELSKSPSGWVAGLTEILEDEDIREAFIINLILNEICTNVPARYKGPQLVLGFYKKLFPKPIRLLDVGSSIGVGVTGLIAGRISHSVDIVAPQAVYQEGLGAPHEVLDRIAIPPKSLEDYRPISLDVELQTDKKVTSRVKAILDEPLEFGPSVGVDVKVRDEPMREWTKSCYYPTEYAENKGRIITQFDELTDLKLPELSLLTLDFTDTEAVEEFLAAESEFDVVTILTMMNQLREDERLKVIENAKKALAPNGLIIIQDFAKSDPNSPYGLEFFESWHPYTYRTFIIDPNSYSKMPQEVLAWETGRCQRAILSPQSHVLTAYRNPAWEFLFESS